MPQLTSKQNPKLIYESLSKSIIGAAMAVHNGLKPGSDEKLYENALVIELCSLGPKSINRKHSKSTTKISTLEP